MISKGVFWFTGSQQFSLGQPEGAEGVWILGTLKALDRDVNRTIQRLGKEDSGRSGEYRQVGVKCSVLYNSGHVQDFEKVLEVRVVDEDDNVPKPQADNEVEVYLDSNIVQKVKKISLILLMHKSVYFYII